MGTINEEVKDDEPIKDEPGWLPGWWMGIFYFTIAFSLFFPVYYHLMQGWSQENQYMEQVKTGPKVEETAVTLKADGSNPFRGDSAAVSEGQKLFMMTCAACHKPDGTGMIGPNLMDGEWLHGNTDSVIYNLVLTGIPQEKLKQKKSPIGGPSSPMPPKGGAPISDTKVLKILAWLSQKNTTLLAGK
ncbi:MAG: c-type cytochrome [Spirochaetia bacterium]|nr:c-type cytochrome [Spirochaetia bacterium]